MVVGREGVAHLRRKQAPRPAAKTAPTGNASRSGGRRLSKDHPRAAEDVRHLQSQISHLKGENKELRQRLDELRRSARSTTVVKKPATQPVSVKLPRIRGAANATTASTQCSEDCAQLRKRAAELEDQLLAERQRTALAEAARDDIKEEFSAFQGEARSLAREQNNRAKEMSADINRLTSELRQVQEEKAAISQRPSVSKCSDCAAKEKLIARHKEAMDKLKGEMAAVAAIAQANMERHKQTQEESVELRTLRHTITMLESDNDRLTTQCIQLQQNNDALRMKQKEVTKSSGDAALGMEVVRLKKALADAIDAQKRTQADHEKQKKEWQQMYKDWMKKAEEKIAELQMANQIIQVGLKKYKTNQGSRDDPDM